MYVGSWSCLSIGQLVSLCMGGGVEVGGGGGGKFDGQKKQHIFFSARK